MISSSLKLDPLDRSSTRHLSTGFRMRENEESICSFLCLVRRGNTMVFYHSCSKLLEGLQLLYHSRLHNMVCPSFHIIACTIQSNRPVVRGGVHLWAAWIQMGIG
jgi:hypothetical protein